MNSIKFITFVVFHSTILFISVWFGLIPNKIEEIPCSIDYVNITSSVMSRIYECACMPTAYVFPLCKDILFSNITGNCYLNNYCSKTNINICYTKYCLKTYIVARLSFKETSKLIYDDCIGDIDYCDNDINVYSCIDHLHNKYNIGTHSCYYRKSDDKGEMYRFKDNKEFVLSIMGIIICSIFLVLGLLCVNFVFL
jgi:hypothetical protein